MLKMTKLALTGVSLMALMQPMQAFAQDQAPADDAAAEGKEIVVTGTLIRGAEVVGSQTISVDAQAIVEKGATSTNELLSIIPQIANTFNGRFEGDPRGYSAGISITKPNLRNLPSSNSTSGGLTLVLVDGMRLTPVGVNQSAIDVDIIPASVLEGIDVVTDGGTSLYGADAVAGVLNFRTMKKFEGIKADGNFGFGTTIKGYSTWDASLTAGTSWDGGNAYISGGHSERDGITNGQTDWATGLVYDAAGVASYSFTQCASAVGTQIRYRYLSIPGVFTGWTNNPGAGGATIPIGTPCDATAAQSYVPRQERSNVFGQLSQEFGDNIDLRVTAYWTKRETTLTNFARGYTTPAQPAPVGAPGSPGAPAASPVTLLGGTGFSFGVNSAYVNLPSRIGFETWGISPELTVKLGGDWQVRNSAHFGRSTNFQSFPGVDQVKAQCYISGCTGIAAGQLNPLDAAAASASVITDILNYESAQDTKQQLLTLRSVADGPLFTLPSGDARLAVGIEYAENKADSRLSAGAIGALSSVPYAQASRNSKSAFAELSLPLTSFADLSGSVRYDDYSDFGSTTNPNIGLTIKPTSWLKLFAHWNTSFNAPTAIDNLAISTGRYACGLYTPNGTPSQRPTDPLGRDTSKQGTCAMVLEGSSPGLQPQTAESWAIGFEATPGDGIRIGGEFYSIDVKNALGKLNPSIGSTYTTNPDLYTYNVNATDYAALLASLTNGTSLAVQQPLASNIALIVDTRTTNLNAAKIEGIDFHASYEFGTSAGEISMGVAGTYQTKAFITNGGVAADKLRVGDPQFFATSHLGWRNGGLSARVTVNYRGSYLDEALNNLSAVEEVDPFVVTNLNFGYNFGGSDGPLSGLSLRLIVDNVFEVKPQVIRRLNTNNPTYNNWTLGRVIKLGASLKL